MAETTSRFSIEGALRAGWQGFTANIVPMALYGLVVLVVGYVCSLLVGDDDAGAIRSTFGSIVLFVVNQLVTIGWLRLALDIVDGRGVSADRVRDSFGIVLPFAVAAIVFSIMLASYVWVDNLLYLDWLAKRGKSGYSEIYYEALELRAGEQLKQLLSEAAGSVGSFWYTAWTEAGRPELR